MCGFRSNTRHLPIAALQRFELDPFIFILSLNFVLRAIGRDLGCRPAIYADDTTLFSRSFSNNTSIVGGDVERDIGRAVELFSQFDLVVDTSETNIVLFFTLLAGNSLQ